MHPAPLEHLRRLRVLPDLLEERGRALGEAEALLVKLADPRPQLPLDVRERGLLEADGALERLAAALVAVPGLGVEPGVVVELRGLEEVPLLLVQLRDDERLADGHEDALRALELARLGVEHPGLLEVAHALVVLGRLGLAALVLQDPGDLADLAAPHVEGRRLVDLPRGHVLRGGFLELPLVDELRDLLLEPVFDEGRVLLDGVQDPDEEPADDEEADDDPDEDEDAVEGEDIIDVRHAVVPDLRAYA